MGGGCAACIPLVLYFLDSAASSSTTVIVSPVSGLSGGA